MYGTGAWYSEAFFERPLKADDLGVSSSWLRIGRSVAGGADIVRVSLAVRRGILRDSEELGEERIKISALMSKSQMHPRQLPVPDGRALGGVSRRGAATNCNVEILSSRPL